MTTSVAFLSRHERFRSVPSTNDIVRAWMTEGTPEVCLAVADEQTAGRGRSGRSWVAPAGAALLLSLGFEPTYLEPDRLWRLAAVVALAMADAAEEAAGLPIGMLKLKWPNDIVVEAARRPPAGVRKVAGVLGESEGAGTADVEGRGRHRRQRRLAARPVPGRAGRRHDQPARGLPRSPDRLRCASRRVPAAPGAAPAGSARRALRRGRLALASGHHRPSRPNRAA